MGYFMPHNVVRRGLVARLVRDGAESVPQRIKIPVSVDAELPEQLGGFLGDGAVVSILGPRQAPLRDEEEAGVGGVLWLGALRQRFAQGRHRLGPQDGPAGYCGLGAGEVDYARV